jgi:PPOX class probable F420-dependent enzyme
LEAADARALFAGARVARLASTRREGGPHLVPIGFALEADTVVTAVDHKPKRDTRLQRLRNIAANPRVALLADKYSEDWTELWWVRADGVARIADPGSADHTHAIELLAERYAPYRERPPEGPAMIIEVERWTGWRYGER